MYKDLSLKEKAKVIREGVRLGLNSIDDILNLYDEAIGHKFLGDTQSLIDKSLYLQPAPKTFTAKKYDYNAPIDWSAESWLNERAENYRGPKYTDEDVKIWNSHVPEYKLIEADARQDGTWMKMSDGSTWMGDPRDWVLMQSKAFKDNYQDKVWYTGQAEWPTTVNYNGEDVLTDKVKRARYHNGLMWFSDNPGYALYFADYIDEKGLKSREYKYNESKGWEQVPYVSGTVFTAAVPKNSNIQNILPPKQGTHDHWQHMPFVLTESGIERIPENKLYQNNKGRNLISKDVLDNKLLTDDLVNHAEKLGWNGLYMYNVDDGPVFINKGNENYVPKESLHMEGVDTVKGTINEFISLPGLTEKLKFIHGNNGDFNPNIKDKYSDNRKINFGNIVAKGGPIVTPYGQWKYPGKDTIIPSNNITMDNVNYPVLGVSDTGDTKVMMPWNDYKFRGSMVYEHPLIDNQFQLGGNTKPTFDLWYPTVPKQKNDTSSYDLRRAYNTLPFDEMEKFRTINDYYLPSVAYDEKTDTYTFLKRNGHPTLNYELDWYNSGTPDALEFRERYKLDTLSLPWRYIPRIYLEGGNTLNYLNIPEYNIALYNTVSPLGDFPNFWGALAYRRLVKDKLKNGNIYERDYKVGDTLGEKTAMAAWAKRLGLPYDELDLPVYNGDTVTLPYSLVLEIPYDTNMLKNRIQLNKALLDKYSKYRYSDVVDAAIKADLYNLDKLRETYKTGKPVGLTEFGWNSRQLVNNGEIIPIEEIQSPLNVLGNYNVRYSPEERRLYYSDEYDFNQFENYVPGEPFRIRGYIDLDNNKASGGNLFKKGGIHINPKNKGKFNATKKRTGKTTEELTHSKNPLTRKRAIFAQNAKKWHHKHDEGGYLYSEGGFLLAPYLYNE